MTQLIDEMKIRYPSLYGLWRCLSLRSVEIAMALHGIHPCISHPEIWIRKPIRSSKHLWIHPKFPSGQKLYQEIISRNDPESPTFDPERHFIDPGKRHYGLGLADEWLYRKHSTDQ